MSDIVWTLGGTVLAIAGVLVLRHAWTLRARSHGLLWLGWALIVGALTAFDTGWGGELGAPFGLIALGLIAYAVIAATAERRDGKARRPRDAVLDPEERSPSWGRAIFKSILAIVLSGIASIGIGVLIAVKAPMPEADRIIVGGLFVPLLWGAGMAWTLCDAKLVRAFFVLVGTSAVAYGIVFLPQVLA